MSVDDKTIKGLVRLRAAFGNSLAGLKDIWRLEEAFRIEVYLLLVSVPIAFLICEDAFSASLLVLSVLFVVIVEVLNTAVEAVVDRVGLEHHELSRMAKDLGSLAVLLSLFFPVILWGVAVYRILVRN